MNLEHLIESYGLAAIFLLMFGESAFVPFPSEITMTFAGFMAGLGRIDFWLAVFIGFAGNMLGAIFAYFVGYTKGRRWTLAAIRKWGSVFLVEESEFALASKWFKKFGAPIILISRMLPVVRAFISLPAGIAKVSFGKFVVLTAWFEF